MPTENRSSNTEQMVSVPAAEIEAACARFAKAQIFDFSRRMRALLAKTAAHHQSEPVAMVRTHGSVCWEEITGESLELCQAQPEEYEVRVLYTLPAEQPAPVAAVLPEPSCRQRLAAEGKPYPRSGCAVCGQFSPKWRECDSLLEVARLNPPQQ